MLTQLIQRSLVGLLASALSTGAALAEFSEAAASASRAKSLASPPVIAESYIARRDAKDRLTSAAAIVDPRAGMTLYVTAAGANQLARFEAGSGRFLQTVGKSGAKLGEFKQPSLIGRADALLFVVDTGNKRLQISRHGYQSKPLGQLALPALSAPSAFLVAPARTGGYRTYLLDNVAGRRELQISAVELVVGKGDSIPPTFNMKSLKSIDLGPVSEIAPAIGLDASGDRLIVAQDKSVSVYTLTGEPVPAAKFATPSLSVVSVNVLECADSIAQGYWILAERNPAGGTAFEVFDRANFALVAKFASKTIEASHAGIMVPSAMAFFPFGALFYPHQEQAIASLSWERVADATGLRKACF